MDRKDYPSSHSAFAAKNELDITYARAIAEEAARAGGKIIRERFGEASIVHWKRGVEAQTPVDIETEQVITRRIAKHFPHDTMNGEELGTRTGTSPYTWVIDPLDGTSNFVLDIPQFAVCISLREREKMLFTVIYQPITDILYIARKGEGAYVNGEKIQVRQQVNSLPKSTVCSILTYEIHGEDMTYFVIDQLRRNTRRLLDTWAPSLDWCLLATGKIDALIYLSNQRMWIDPGMLAGAFFFLEAGGNMGNLEGNITTDITQFMSVIAASSPAMIQNVCQVIAPDSSCKTYYQNTSKSSHAAIPQASTDDHPLSLPHSYDISL